MYQATLSALILLRKLGHSDPDLTNYTNCKVGRYQVKQKTDLYLCNFEAKVKTFRFYSSHVCEICLDFLVLLKTTTRFPTKTYFLIERYTGKQRQLLLWGEDGEAGDPWISPVTPPTV